MVSKYFCHSCGDRFFDEPCKHILLDMKNKPLQTNSFDTRMKIDPVIEAVRKDLHDRSQVGITKYGTTLADNQGDLRYWLNHAYEECLDQANYLKRCIMEIDNTNTHIKNVVNEQNLTEEQKIMVKEIVKAFKGSR